MAKLTNGILGPLQGGIGPVINSSWKGIPYVKARGSKIGHKRSEGVTRNFTKFSILHYWLRPLIDLLRVGFKGYAPRVEGFNGAKSYAMKYAFTGEETSKTLDPSLVLVSYGKLALPSFIHLDRKDSSTLEFSWDTALVGDLSHPNDQVMLLAYDNVRGEAIMKLTGQFREVGKDTLTINPVQGRTYHVYAAFTGHDRSNQSNSIYLGMITT